MTKVAVVLFNLGGPDGPEAVEPFLVNLFTDPAILRVPWPIRPLLGRLIARRRVKAARANYDRHRSDVLLEHNARFLVGERNFANGGEHVRGTNGRMSGERHFATRREDPNAAGVFRVLRRKDERRLRVVELARDRGHLLGR